MAIVLTVANVEKGSRRMRDILYTAVLSGTYANPEVLDFSLATNSGFHVNAFPSEAPKDISIEGCPAGFGMNAVIGSTHKNGTLKIYNGTAQYSEETFSAADLKGATAPAGTEENADQNAGPVNEAVISALATFTASAGTLTIANQPDIGRSVIVVVKNTTGGALNLFQGVTTYTVTGKFRGAAQVETITFTSTVGNKAIAAGKFRYKAGVKPFDSITSITYDNAGDGTLSIEVAPGSKIGLPVNSATAADADFVKVMNTAANYAFAGKVDYTNWALDFGTTADNWDFLVEYMIVAGEVPSGFTYPAALTAAPLRIRARFRGL